MIKSESGESKIKQMKKSIFLILSLFFFFAIASCSRGSGCPSESAAGNVNKKGQIKTTPGKSNLFDKKTRKQMRN